MTTAYTSLLGLALPVTGELSGTWGDTVNNYITQYLDASVAGTLTVNADTTLTKTTGVALNSTSSQYAILIASGHSTNITITAPAASKEYLVINTSGTYTVRIRGAGPTTGVTLAVNERAIVAWNGSDFVRVASSIADLSSVTGTLAVANGGTGITSFGSGVATALGQNVSGSGGIALTTSATFTTPNLGTPSAAVLTNATGLPLSTGVTGTLPAANGGTGIATPGSAGNFLQSTGSTWTSATTLGIANGGTNGSATPTAGALAYGTGTAFAFTSAGTAGQVLQSNGASAPSWTSVGLSGLGGMQVFTTSGTFTIPAGKTVIKATIIGGGGGGGGGGTSAGFLVAGGGGGGGATAVYYLTGVTPGNTITVTIGTGGAGGAAGDPGNNGSAGTSSSISSGTQTIITVTAGGGNGGGGSNVSSEPGGGGAGGTATNGTLNLSGGSGQAGFATYSTSVSLIRGGIGGVSTASPSYGQGGTGAPGRTTPGSNGNAGVVFFEY